MATKKRSKKKAKRKAVGKKAAPRRKLAKKAAPKRKPLRKKAAWSKKRVRGKSEDIGSVVFEPKGLGARSAGQSGDLQGFPASRERLRKAWKNCSRKEMRLRLN